MWLAQSDDPALILVFGGWALGATPFDGLTSAGNVLLVQDYANLDSDLPDLSGFNQVDLLAFSFGVASAAHWLDQEDFRPNRLVAVSGTLHPADADKGIAPDTIRATADQLSPDSFAKFCRRAGLKTPPCNIDLRAAQVELQAVAARGSAPDPGFDRVWIPNRDRIIPTSAQEAAWAGQDQAIRRIAGSHVPFRSGQSWAEWLQ